MPRKFSIINVGDTQLVKSGFVEPDLLAEIQEVVETVYDTSIYENIQVNIQHMLFLDFPDAEIGDVSEEEVEILEEKLEELYKLDCLEEQERIEFSLQGLSEDKEIIELIE